MSRPTGERPAAAMAAVIERITREWADKGCILEGGWRAFEATAMDPAAPEVQRREMRRAYFLGAQHLWASMMTFLEPGVEPTGADLGRMSQIHDELEAFRKSLGN